MCAVEKQHPLKQGLKHCYSGISTILCCKSKSNIHQNKVSSVNKMYRMLERCEIGKLGLKGDKSRILKLTSITNAQKNILEMFNCKYLGMNNHLKSIGVKKM